MGLEAGTKLGPYEIQARLGEGGMGEVYRARDSRLQRSVAIKILKAASREDPISHERMRSEARAISALQHPNICTLFDIGEHNSRDYLVMECLEGETLAQRLQRGSLPLPEFLKYAIQICAGLERAHASRVIHRDLKPANIMLTMDGAKIVDFGLAQLTRLASTDGETFSSPLTMPGAFVGTLGYMSPEQLEGAAVDEQSDIFSLGAVFYEMATGKRSFPGQTQASIIAAVLDRDPQGISTVHPGFPRSIDRLVQSCLQKKPEDRWRSVHDIRLQLMAQQEELAAGVQPAPVRQRPGIAGMSPWLWLGLLAILGAAAIALRFHEVPAAPSRPIRSSILPPATWSFLQSSISLSPDGTRIAFVGVSAEGATELWIRSLINGAAQKLGPADFACVPFWSPDGSRVGYFAESKLKIISATGGSPQTLAEAPFGRGGAWNSEGTIVFAPSLYGPLQRISEKGGTATPVTRLPREDSSQVHRWPLFLPDGKHFLFTISWSSPEDTPGDGLYVGSLNSADEAPTLVSKEIGGNVALAADRLLFVRDLSLLSQPFDLQSFQLKGFAEPVTEQEVPTYEPMELSSFSASQTGVIVYQSLVDLNSQLLWFDSAGRPAGQVGAVRPSDPRLSPDGRQLAFASDEGLNGKTYIHIYDLSRQVNARLTDGGKEVSPVWSPDGKKIAYISRTGEKYQIYQIPADGSGPPELLLQGPRTDHLDWSSTGKIICSDFIRGRPLLAFFSPGEKSLHEMHFGAEARFSPDAHWIAYTLGGPAFRPEVVVEAFPGPGAHIQISRDGGAQATWSADGKRIYFIAPDKKMMAVDFDAGKQSAGAPKPLFQTSIIAPKFILRQYDVTRDGRFVINSLPQGSAPPITMITGWTPGKKE
jgi:eukaryotic-like serine/threonine-protein kinase